MPDVASSSPAAAVEASSIARAQPTPYTLRIARKKISREKCKLTFDYRAPNFPSAPVPPKECNEDDIRKRVLTIFSSGTDLELVCQHLNADLFPHELLQQFNGMPPDAHLWLDIDPKLDWIPWELLCDAGQFLCLRFCVGRTLHHFSLKEHNALRTRMAAARPGIAFVAVGATDDLKAAMDEGDEVRAILWNRYKRDVPCDRMPSRDALRGEIVKSYDVFHFCGHGAFEANDSAHTGWRCRKGGLLSCKDIHDYATSAIFPYLIFANSCDSAHSSIEESEQYISSLHRAFHYRGVPHYIGTLTEIRDSQAKLVAHEFFQELTRSATVGQALQKARRSAQHNGWRIWASYVHYGNPSDRLFEEERAEAGRGSPGLVLDFVPAEKKRKWTHKNIALGAALTLVLIILILAVGFYIRWRAERFAAGTFGIAIAKFEVKDLATSSVRMYDEHLLSIAELEPFMQSALTRSPFEMRSTERVFLSHDDARSWGIRRRPSIVIWGTAERGSQGFIVHLKATRIPLPETSHRTETYRRFFVQKLFPEYFRDAETYATDFEIGGVPIDLANPTGMSVLESETAEFARFCQGVLVYTKGEYLDAAKSFEQVASSKATEDVRRLAKQWLVLTYLNARNYTEAERIFAALMDQKSPTDEDVVRHAFLKVAYKRNVEGIAMPWIDDAERDKLWGILGAGELSPYLGITLAVLLTDGLTGELLAGWPRDYPFEEGKKGLRNLSLFEKTLERAVTDLPEDYFLQYLRAMLSTNADIADEALKRAEALRPQAAEPHFARAVTFSKRGDTEAALREIDAAIGAEPTQLGYWEKKLYVLKGRTYDTLGPAHHAARLQEAAFGEEILKKPYGTKSLRMFLAANLAHAYVRARKFDQAAAVLEKEAAELPEFCKLAAMISMREIGSLPLARKFFECAARQGSSVADQDLERLVLEYRWRNGDYQEVIDRLRLRVFRDRKPDRSVALIETLGNVFHAAGRYDDAEKLLQEAKRRATKVSRGPRSFAYGEGDYTLSEEDQKWNWIASFDLAFVYLSQGNYAKAIRELQHAREYLRTTKNCPQCGRSEGSIYDFHRHDLAYWTEMSLGYAYFKQGDYESAAQGWWAASVPMTYTGFPSQRLLEERIQNDLTANLRRFMEDPEHSGKALLLPEGIVDQMLILQKYAEARNFMERYILSMGDQPDDRWTPRLLLVFVKLHDLQRVDQLFTEFVRSHSGGLNSKAVFAGLTTSLVVEPMYESASTGPNFFWDVIARNPYPD